MHFQQLNYTSEPKAAVFARIGRKNRDCRGGSVADGAIGLRIVTFRFFDLFRNHPPPFRARIPLLLRDTPFRRSISPLTAAVHKMLIGFPCERLGHLQKHYICIHKDDGSLPPRHAAEGKGTPVQFRDYPRSCNFHDKGRTISATAASGRREGVPAGTSQKTCRPPFVRSFRVEEPDDAICPAGIICPYRRGRCRIAFIPATPQPKSPFPTVTGHGASVRSAGSAAEDDSTGIVAMKGGEETLRNASPTGFHADARPKISHPLPSDACQL